LKSVFIIAIAAVAMIGMMIPSGFSEKEGVLLQQDENIYIHNFNYYPMLGGTAELGYTSQSVILGDIVNISENDLFYVVLRANIYDDNELITTTLEFPSKIHLRSGESSTFSIYPEWTGWDCFELWIEDYKDESNTDTVNGAKIDKKINDVIQVTMTDNRGQLKIKVKNTDIQPIYNVWVNVAKYDNNDNIVGMAYEFIPKINAEQTKKVEVMGYLAGYKTQSDLDKYIYEQPDRIEIEVEGRTYQNDSPDFSYFHGKNSDEMYVKSIQSFLLETHVGNNLSGNIIGDHIDLDFVKSSIQSELQNPSKKGYCTKQLISEPEIIETSLSIPKWIKNNAGWWASDEIDDNAFLTGIAYMVSNNILEIPSSKKVESNYDDIVKNNSETKIPKWIKNNAGWWADDLINDEDFAMGIQYLIKTGIIIVN
jgi:hypothetical protein